MKMDELIEMQYKRHGYYEGMKISRKEFDRIVAEEKLNEYTRIAFNPDNTREEDMVSLLHRNGKYTVVMAGERAHTSTKDFSEMEEALAYMVFKLRCSKSVASKYENWRY